MLRSVGLLPPSIMLLMSWIRLSWVGWRLAGTLRVTTLPHQPWPPCRPRFQLLNQGLLLGFAGGSASFSIVVPTLLGPVLSHQPVDQQVHGFSSAEGVRR